MKPHQVRALLARHPMLDRCVARASAVVILILAPVLIVLDMGRIVWEEYRDVGYRPWDGVGDLVKTIRTGKW